MNTKTRKRSDDALLDDLDLLVADAANGNGRAVGAIAIAFAPTLLSVAREELGGVQANDDASVLQDLCDKLTAGTLPFPRVRHGALPWLKETVRTLARDRLRARSVSG